MMNINPKAAWLSIFVLTLWFMFIFAIFSISDGEEKEVEYKCVIINEEDLKWK